MEEASPTKPGRHLQSHPPASPPAPGSKREAGPTQDTPNAGTAPTSSGDITATEVTSLVPHLRLQVPPGAESPGTAPVRATIPSKKARKLPAGAGREWCSLSQGYF